MIHPVLHITNGPSPGSIGEGGNMSLWNLPLPNLIGYLVVLWVLMLSLADLFAVREKYISFASAERDFDHQLGPRLQSGEYIEQEDVVHLCQSHPSAIVLKSILAEPEISHDKLALDTWISSAIQHHIGGLRTRMESLHAAAPAIGLLGTIMGLLIATWTYGQTHDQGQMMTAVSLGMLKTLVAGIATLIERWMLDKLESLEEHLVLHAQKTAARARLSMAHNFVSVNNTQSKRSEYHLLDETRHPKSSPNEGLGHILVHKGNGYGEDAKIEK